MTDLHNAADEATAVLPEGHVALVLEPSPPAVHDGHHFADDPTDPTSRGGTRLDDDHPRDVPDGSGAGTVVTPVAAGVPEGGRTWADVVAELPGLAPFARDRWLVPERGLPELPAELASTRAALHRLALHVVYRLRRQANGKYGLRWTLGGFGTPFYGDDEQVRVDGATLVHQRGGTARAAPLTSLRAAGSFLGLEVDPDFDHGFRDVVDAGDVDADLGVDAGVSRVIGDWFGFATAVLEEIRAERGDADPTRVQLWPEHFDAAIDLAYGEPAGERRVNVGASPGDGGHDDPYLYVGPWTDDRPGGDGYWNAGFGAVLGYRDLLVSGDGSAQRARALAFVREGLDRLATHGS